LKTRKNGENTYCILANELYRFSHKIPPYKMSNDERECISIYSLKLYPTVPPTDMFQLTDEYDRT